MQRVSWRRRAVPLALLLGAGAFWQLAARAQWTPAPNVMPPGQNVPGPIWNASAPGFQGPQQGSISVDGSGGFGGNLAIDGSGGFGGYAPTMGLALTVPQSYVGDGMKGTIIGAYQNLTAAGDILTDGKLTVGELLAVGGSAGFGGHAPGMDLAVSAPQSYIGDGTKGTIIGAYQNVTSPGDILTDGKVTAGSFFGDGGGLTNISCAVGKFDHLTQTSYTGNIGNYAAANSACGDGSHICTPDELLTTVRCAADTLPMSGNAWVANGPPGFTSPAANDCAGWTSASAGSYGTFWQFAGTAGGKAFATSCNLTLAVACCK